MPIDTSGLQVHLYLPRAGSTVLTGGAASIPAMAGAGVSACPQQERSGELLVMSDRSLVRLDESGLSVQESSSSTMFRVEEGYADDSTRLQKSVDHFFIRSADRTVALWQLL